MLTTCPRCGSIFHSFDEKNAEGECPHCADKTQTPVPEAHTWSETVELWWQLLRHPSRYFTEAPTRNQPLSMTLVIGPLLSGCSWIVIAIAGSARRYDISPIRATFALIAPALLLSIILFLFLGFVLFMIALVLGGAMSIMSFPSLGIS